MKSLYILPLVAFDLNELCHCLKCQFQLEMESDAETEIDDTNFILEGQSSSTDNQVPNKFSVTSRNASNTVNILIKNSQINGSIKNLLL